MNTEFIYTYCQYYSYILPVFIVLLCLFRLLKPEWKALVQAHLINVIVMIVMASLLIALLFLLILNKGGGSGKRSEGEQNHGGATQGAGQSAPPVIRLVQGVSSGYLVIDLQGEMEDLQLTGEWRKNLAVELSGYTNSPKVVILESGSEAGIEVRRMVAEQLEGDGFRVEEKEMQSDEK